MLILAVTVAAVAAVRGMWSPCGLSMLSSLNPLAEGARGHRYPLTAGWYLAGAAAGGALLGGGCALAGLGLAAVPAPWRWALALLGAAVALASDLPVTRFSLPVHPRQVDERWLTTYRRWIYAGGYGLQIGTGFATYIMTAAVYLTALLAALTGDPVAALLVGVVFGTVRGCGVLVTAALRSPEGLRALMARVDGWAARSLDAARAAETAVAVAAAWALGGPVVGGAVTAALLLAGLALLAVPAVRTG